MIITIATIMSMMGNVLVLGVVVAAVAVPLAPCVLVLVPVFVLPDTCLIFTIATKLITIIIIIIIIIIMTVSIIIC